MCDEGGTGGQKVQAKAGSRSRSSTSSWWGDDSPPSRPVGFVESHSHMWFVEERVFRASGELAFAVCGARWNPLPVSLPGRSAEFAIFGGAKRSISSRAQSSECSCGVSSVWSGEENSAAPKYANLVSDCSAEALMGGVGGKKRGGRVDGGGRAATTSSRSSDTSSSGIFVSEGGPSTPDTAAKPPKKTILTTLREVFGGAGSGSGAAEHKEHSGKDAVVKDLVRAYSSRYEADSHMAAGRMQKHGTFCDELRVGPSSYTLTFPDGTCSDSKLLLLASLLLLDNVQFCRKRQGWWC